VRGENVYPSAIENAIRSIDGFGDEFRIVITREKTMDELIVQAEPVPGTDNESTLKLAGMLETALKTKGLRTLVRMQPPGTLERTEFKAKRIIDQRDLYDEMTQG
jgi:phenylacetate-coenzyme A ligase PaaK-like adenylate-forming protein